MTNTYKQGIITYRAPSKAHKAAGGTVAKHAPVKTHNRKAFVRGEI